MKIVFNTDQIYLHGGIEKVMAIKANYFANLPETEVYVLTTEQKGKPSCYPLDDKIKLIDLKIDYNRHKSYFAIENIKKACKHFFRQRKLLKTLKPDVVISSNYNFDFYWLPFICKKSKKIKEIHNSRYNWKPGLKNTLNSWFESKYHNIVVLNRDEASYFQSKNVVVIPNPIAENPQIAPLDAPLVIAAGRISPVKRFEDLISAWHIVHSHYLDWKLEIYGQDYLGTKQRLEEQINELSLQNVVKIKDPIPDIMDRMLESSIYAMSSFTECFPMVLLEALSVGLPIVSYDCPNGPRNIITDKKEGLLARNGDIHDLASKLEILIRDEELRKQMGKTGKENVSRFSVDEIMNKWLNLIYK